MGSKQTPRSIRISFDPTVDSEPLQGHIQEADGTDHAFVGWLELIQTLDDVRAGPPEAP